MSSAEMTSDGPMTTRIPPILRLVFAACTVGLFGELPKADEPPAGSLHTADLLARCLAIEPARPAFAKEAMVPYVSRLLAAADTERAVAGWLAAAADRRRLPARGLTAASAVIRLPDSSRSTSATRA